MSARSDAAAILGALLLFDIDGTLIRGSRAARTAFARTVQACFGVSVDLSAIHTAGKTDLLIMREILDACGLEAQTIDDRVIASYLRHLEAAVRSDPGDLCPGVLDLLRAVSGRPGLRLALGTGHLEQSARMKLAPHGLDGFFPTGGFGDVSADRDAIIAAAIATAEAYYAARFACLVVVGDTPHDVASASANQAYSLGVATGPYDARALRDAGATLVFDDLSRTEAVIRAVETLPPARQ